MKTILTIGLTLLLIGLLPMWPYPTPSAVVSVFGGLAMFAAVLVYHVLTDHVFTKRSHHWPR
jgi:hypothetical protein